MSDSSEPDSPKRSERSESPRGSEEPDGSAWAEACAEDLAAERARRREQAGERPASAADEFGRLVDSVARRISDFTTPLAGAAGESAGRRAAESTAEQWSRQLAEGAKELLGPVVERNPRVLEHLAAAGSELLSAYQAAVSGHEQRWTRQEAASVRVPRDDEPAAPTSGPAPCGQAGEEPRKQDGEEAASGEEPRAAGRAGDGERAGSVGGEEPSGGPGGDDPPATERIDLD
ncbi:DUF5304 domain-containing protein [Streptomyces sp. P38-E01]|uniref:DUF5304 domain-containing protein n=1 Tax=Streptomyces tardus TaxID=2780544 RepID=A0A949JHF4_9ACTN|nr:DUF5304 family protein [Streptomyces tardus]MBU7599517.1 DUF5304 domain-containing protein [Streptomyces tardus]